MNKKLLPFPVALMILAFFFASCDQYTGKWEERAMTLKGGEGNINYQIPDDIPNCTEALVGPEASQRLLAEHCNRYRNLYFVVIEHEKEAFASDSLDPFTSFSASCLKRLMNDGAATSMKVLEKQMDTLDNGSIMLTAELFGYMGEDNPIFYFHRTLDAGASFVEATAWTRGEKRRLEHGDKLRKVISSIKYTNP